MAGCDLLKAMVTHNDVGFKATLKSLLPPPGFALHEMRVGRASIHRAGHAPREGGREGGRFYLYGLL